MAGPYRHDTHKTKSPYLHEEGGGEEKVIRATGDYFPSLNLKSGLSKTIFSFNMILLTFLLCK